MNFKSATPSPYLTPRKENTTDPHACRPPSPLMSFTPPIEAQLHGRQTLGPWNGPFKVGSQNTLVEDWLRATPVDGLWEPASAWSPPPISNSQVPAKSEMQATIRNAIKTPVHQQNNVLYDTVNPIISDDLVMRQPPSVSVPANVQPTQQVGRSDQVKSCSNRQQDFAIALGGNETIYVTGTPPGLVPREAQAPVPGQIIHAPQPRTAQVPAIIEPYHSERLVVPMALHDIVETAKMEFLMRNAHLLRTQLSHAEIFVNTSVMATCIGMMRLRVHLLNHLSLYARRFQSAEYAETYQRQKVTLESEILALQNELDMQRFFFRVKYDTTDMNHEPH